MRLMIGCLQACLVLSVSAGMTAAVAGVETPTAAIDVVSPADGAIGCDGGGPLMFLQRLDAETGGDFPAPAPRAEHVSGEPAGASPAPPRSTRYFYAGGEIASSPKPINLEGDARPGIVFGTSAGQIYVLTADGIPAPGWPVVSGTMVGYCSAAVADLDGDNVEDIVVHANNQLQAYAQDGSPLPGWPQALDSNVSGNSVVASPCIADIDNDGDPEIMIGHVYRMYAFHHDGSAVAGWPIQQSHAFGPMYATPAAGDLDGDGDLEICFKIYGGNGDPADIYLMHHDGTDLPGWPKLDLDRSHLSSPVFADVDDNGELDIVVSLHFYDSGNYVRLYVWRPDGSDVPGFPVAGSWNTAPENNAVGDADGDGSLEIFVSTSNYTTPYYAVHAWNHDGSVLAGAWPRSASMCLVNGSPALADADGGNNEIIIGVGGCYVDDTGDMNVWAADGTLLPDWPQPTEGKLRSSPLVMDSDFDGTPEIYIGATDGWIHRFLAEDATGGSEAEWNQIFHDPRNTNLYAPPGADCPADFDGDGDVDTADLLFLLGAWGTPDGDVDGDGDTDTADLLALLAAWGDCP
ncbi:MAG: VCBS repeat-containing protein [Planctomycetota bacterium]|nr:VCBS repeat-containing protein [Planctomycetota bacterium]